MLEAAARAYPAFAAAVRDPQASLLELAVLLGEGLTSYDVTAVERQVEFLAWLVEREAEETTDPRRRLAALRQVVHVEEGFHGNPDDDYTPEDSFLGDVLTTRTGLPIALSVLDLAIAQRLGWPLVGVDFPLHFLLRYQEPGELLIVDPFHGGQVIGMARLIELARPAYANLPAERLEPLLRLRLSAEASPRRIVSRMLKNLENLYLKRKDYHSVKNVIEKLLLLDPTAAGELRDLGEVFHLLGKHRRALECLRGYLAGTPAASDRAHVEAIVTRLQDLLRDED